MKVAGNAYHLYMFNAGCDIDLSKVAKVADKIPELTELRYTKLMPKYVKITPPPLEVELQKRRIGDTLFSVIVRVYGVGVVTVCFVHKFNCEIGDLVECNEERLLEEATAVYRKTRSSMKDCITKKQDGEQEPEDYRVFVIKRMGKPMSGLEFLRQNTAEIAGLMRQERDPGILSEEEVARSVKNSFSFYKRDLAVIGYLDALIVEPEDETDAVLTLEIANIELLKLRIYDRLLDRYLEAAYHDLREVSVSRLKLIFMSRRLGRIARAISEAKAETSELIGNVMNMSRFIGDWYTGRIYSAVAERLHLKDWEQEVVRKIDVLEEAYTMIFDKINSYQLIVLEVLVVLLIVFEIVMSLMKWA